MSDTEYMLNVLASRAKTTVAMLTAQGRLQLSPFKLAQQRCRNRG